MSASGSREFYDTMRDLFLEDMGLGATGDLDAEGREGPFTLGRYLLTEELGRGAFSRVYRGLHQDLMKPVAVKVFDGPLDERRRERLTREATTGARLRHPGIVAIHDVGIDRERHYIAMDLLEGGTFQTWLATEPPLDDRVAMIETIARAIHFAHEGGVLHRDLKPENVLMDADGSPVVADFGLARCVDDVRMTRDGSQVGTPGYMAPEQVRGDLARIDARTDVHALGVMLYEAITGKLPYGSSGTDEVYRRILEVPAPRPSRAGCVVPPELEAVCLRCLEKDPALRYADAEALAEDLRRFLGGLPVAAANPSALGMLRRRIIRGRRAILRVAVVAAVVVVATIWAVDTDSHRDRLGEALAIQSASSDISQRLSTLMSDALRHRYGGDPAHRAAIVERVDALVTDTEDATGVGEAHRAWVRLLLETEDAQAFLAVTRSRFPDNPLVPLFAARAHVLRYADHAPMPQTWVPIDSTRSPVRYHVTDEPGTVGADRLRAAAIELERARSSDVWSLLPALAWMVDLMDGSLAYARGDNEAAIAMLEPLTGRGDAFEACLLVILAHTRIGDDEAALATALALDRRHPGVQALRQRVVECYRLRGMVAMARGEDPEPHFEAARKRRLEITPEPDHDVVLADLDFNVAEHRARTGRLTADDLRRVIASYDRVLERHPDWRPAWVGRGRSRARLARLEGAGEDGYAAALADLDRASELAPDDPPQVFGRIEARLDLVRAASKRRDVPAEEFDRLTEDVELFSKLVGADPFRDYYVTLIDFVRSTNDRMHGRVDLERMREIAARAVELRDAIPETPEVEQLALASRLALVESDPAAAPESFERLVREVIERVDSSPLYRRFPAGVDRWLAGQLHRVADLEGVRDRGEQERARNVGLAKAGLTFFEWAVDRDLPPRRVAAGLWQSAWVARIHDESAAVAALERAVDALDELADEHGEVGAVHMHLSSCWLALLPSLDPAEQRDAAGRALRAAREANRLDEESADSWLALARALVTNRRNDEAVDALERARDLSPAGSGVARAAAALLATLEPD